MAHSTATISRRPRGRGAMSASPASPAGGSAGTARFTLATVARAARPGIRKPCPGRRVRAALWPPRPAVLCCARRAHGRMTAVDRTSPGGRMRWRMPLRIGFLAGVLAVTACGTSVTGTANPAAPAASGQARAAAANPDLDPGTSLGGDPAPGFRLVSQFGQPMSLRQFRGKVVILAFTDSQCTTVCPLTTASMLEARALLGAAGDQVQLLGINANPKATAVNDVMAYSRAHGMVSQWDFLTGSLAQLTATWQAYHIYARIQAGQIDHTPALYVIDQRGRERKIYLTAMAYASIGQAAQILAAEADRKSTRLNSSHPSISYAVFCLKKKKKPQQTLCIFKKKKQTTNI